MLEIGKAIKAITVFILMVMGAGWAMWGNNSPVITRVDVDIKNLPPSLEGFTILHLSDLHSRRFGKGQQEIFSLVREEDLDMVAVTGDLIDAGKREFDAGLELVEVAGKRAPVYFVPGNHEKASGLYSELKRQLLARNVQVLDDGTALDHPAGDSQVTVAGVGLDGITRFNLQKQREKGPVILLSHYPGVFDGYAGRGVDLMLAGHTHGGQIRLPLIGALWVPGQGFFPKYDAGLFLKDSSYLYISRGLGTSEIDFRFLCRPEVSLLTLKRG